MILLSHSSILIGPESPDGIHLIIRFLGTIGVDVFFVLSGFLIGGLLIKNIENNKTSFKHLRYFWIRRWFKTIPNYVLVLVINIGIMQFFWPSNNIGFSSYLFFLQNFSHAMPDFFTESWSLTIEEFSYLLGPLLLYLGLMLKPLRKPDVFMIITLMVILLGVVNRMYYNLYFTPENMEQWSHDLRKVVIYRIDSIYYGFIGAYLIFYCAEYWKKIKISALFVGLTVFVLIHFCILYFQMNPGSYPLFFNALYIPILMLSILCFFPYVAAIDTRNLRVKIIVEYISRTSYAIYLVNYSIVLLGIQYAFNINEFSFIQNLGLLLAFWCLTLILSYMLYTFYERPIMNIRDHGIFKPVEKIA